MAFRTTNDDEPFDNGKIDMSISFFFILPSSYIPRRVRQPQLSFELMRLGKDVLAGPGLAHYS